MGLSTLSLGRGHIERRVDEPALGKLLQRDWLLESEAFVAADPFFHATGARIAALRDSVARLPYQMTGFPAAHRESDSAFAPDVRNYLLGLSVCGCATTMPFGPAPLRSKQ